MAAHDLYPNLRLVDHPLVRHKLALARDARTSSHDFRRLLREIAALMAYELCADLPTRETEVTTPLEVTRGARLAQPLALVPILRAGMGMADGIRELVPDALMGHIGLYRDEASLEPVSYYTRLPPGIEGSLVLVVDPMLATGGSASRAVTILKAQGCARIKLVCLVAAPPGVARMHEEHPEVAIYAAALDRGLDENGFIRPGLGDAGDRIFGTA